MVRKILRIDLVAGVLQACVQFGTAFVQMRDRTLERFFPFANIGIWRMVSGESPDLKE